MDSRGSENLSRLIATFHGSGLRRLRSGFCFRGLRDGIGTGSRLFLVSLLRFFPDRFSVFQKDRLPNRNFHSGQALGPQQVRGLSPGWLSLPVANPRILELIWVYGHHCNGKEANAGARGSTGVFLCLCSSHHLSLDTPRAGAHRWWLAPLCLAPNLTLPAWHSSCQPRICCASFSARWKRNKQYTVTENPFLARQIPTHHSLPPQVWRHSMDCCMIPLALRVAQLMLLPWISSDARALGGGPGGWQPI